MRRFPGRAKVEAENLDEVSRLERLLKSFLENDLHYSNVNHSRLTCKHFRRVHEKGN